MVRKLVLALPLATAWVLLSFEPTPVTFIVGYVFSIGILYLIDSNTGDEDENPSVSVVGFPKQLWALITYGAQLAWDIVFSGIDVAKRILPREMDINPGIYCVDTFDEDKHKLVSGLSAHSITITPGSLVIDHKPEEHNMMYVHVLDVNDWTQESLEEEQKGRLNHIKRILGYE